MFSKAQIRNKVTENHKKLAEDPKRVRCYGALGEWCTYVKSTRSSDKLVYRHKISKKVGSKSVKKIIEIEIGDALTLSIDEIKKKIAEIQLTENNDRTIVPELNEFIDPFIKFISKNRSSKRKETYQSIINNHLDPFLHERVDKLTAPFVVKEIEKMDISDYTKYATLSALRIILDFVIANYSYLEFNPLNVVKNNPMVSIKKPQSIGFKYVAPDIFVEVLLQKLDSIAPKHALFILFLVMTGLRIGSALETRYEYINKNDMKIIYPAEKMKMRRDFELPITDRLKNLLKHIEEEFKFHVDVVFYSSKNPNKHFSLTTIQTIVKTISNSTISAHSFRKIMRTYLTSIKVPVSIAKMCLAHKVPDQIDEIYNKFTFYEEKRNAFEAWHEFIYKNISNHLKKYLDE